MATMTLKNRIIGQFRKPTGPAGSLAGWIMATRPSNRRRNAWAVDQLDIQPDDRVLEIGFGPGLAQARIARRLRAGRYVGVDHSRTMVEQASRRNRRAVADGRVKVLLGSVDDVAAGMPGLTGPFTKALAVNVAMFWRDLDAGINGIYRALAPTGMLAIAHQPRTSPATDEAAFAEAARLTASMHDAGFAHVETRTFDAVSPIAVCVVASKNKGQ